MKLNEPKVSETSKWPKQFKCSIKNCEAVVKTKDKVCSLHLVHRSQPRDDYYTKSKSGLLIENKTYLDYLRESEYKESYRKFWTQHFPYLVDERRQRYKEVYDDKKPPEGD